MTSHAVSLPAALLRELFQAAVTAADPGVQLPLHLPTPPQGRTIVVGAGKASARMAQVLEDCWSGPLEGLVVTRYGHSVPCRSIEIVEAAHPVPDQAGMHAAQRILNMVKGLTQDDLVVVLISGGGSSLLSLPASGLTLADKQAVNAALLRSGAAIGEMNCVRKHLSAIKGGRLAEAIYPAHCHTLLISDVPGDDPGTIASGPTIGESAHPDDARRILSAYRIDLPATVVSHLASRAAFCVSPSDVRLSRAEHCLIATPRMSLNAAAALGAAKGYEIRMLGDAIEGEARMVALSHAAAVRDALPVRHPVLLLSGGETSVRVTGNGRGGRNVEFLLALAMALDGRAEVHALAADTDGIDGQEEIAGAVCGPDTLSRARALGLDPAACLANNDAHSFFEHLGDQVITGPTLTNVNDFRAILIEPQNR